MRHTLLMSLTAGMLALAAPLSAQITTATFTDGTHFDYQFKNLPDLERPVSSPIRRAPTSWPCPGRSVKAIAPRPSVGGQGRQSVADWVVSLVSRNYGLTCGGITMGTRGVRSVTAAFSSAAAAVALSSLASGQLIKPACTATQIMEQSGADNLDHMGQSIAIGDFNGDGIKDIALGGFDRLSPDPLEQDPTLTNGYGTATTRVFVFLGTGNSPGSGLPLFHHRLTIAGEGLENVETSYGHTDLFGYSVAFIGDLNGDGCEELVVGAPAFNGSGHTECGRVSFFFGSTALHASDTGTDLLWAATAHNMTFDGSVDYGWFGAALATAHDASGGALSDVLIGAPGKWGATHAGSMLGSVYQFQSPIPQDAATIAGSTPGVTIRVSATAGTPGIVAGGSGYVATANRLLPGDHLGDFFGHAIAFVGDVDGVAGQEFLVGAPDYNTELQPPWDFGGTGKGRASLFTLTSATPLIVIEGTQAPASGVPGEGCGSSVAGGVKLDHNDNVPDLLIGSPLFTVHSGGMGGDWTYAGRVRAFSGAAAALGVPTAMLTNGGTNGTLLTGESPGAQFGSAVSGVSDMNLDGLDEVLVGAWQQAIRNPAACGGAQNGRTGSGGAAYLYLPSSTFNGSAAVNFYGEVAKDHLGRAVAAGQLFGSSSVPEVVLTGLAFSDPALGSGVTETGRGYVWNGDTVLQ